MIVKDQIGRDVSIGGSPKRIVSLVPSQTELLHYLHLENEVVGITKFCLHPNKWFVSKNRVGGTKSVDISAVRELRPDLIIGNKEENTQEDIKELEKIASVWMSDVNSFDEAIDMIQSIGLITNRLIESRTLIAQINSHFNQLNIQLQNSPPKHVLYFIWNEPDYVAGKSTFINSMIEKAGYLNACEDHRYPEPDNSIQPDLVFLSSEPYPFKEIHLEKFKNKYPLASIHFVDGEMFSWYGSRMMLATNYFKVLAESCLK